MLHQQKAEQITVITYDTLTDAEYWQSRAWVYEAREHSDRGYQYELWHNSRVVYAGACHDVMAEAKRLNLILHPEGVTLHGTERLVADNTGEVFATDDAAILLWVHLADYEQPH